MTAPVGPSTWIIGVIWKLSKKSIHFQGVEGDWICLEFKRSVLKKKYGIVVKDEVAMPVGDQEVSIFYITK